MFPSPSSLGAQHENAVFGDFGADGRLSRAELADEVSRAMQWLQSLGLNQNELVALSTSNARMHIIWSMALLYAGIPQMPLDLSIPVGRMKKLLAQGKPQLHLRPEGGDELHSNVKSMNLPEQRNKSGKGIGRFLKKKPETGGHPVHSFKPSWPPEEWMDMPDNAVALVFFTSGTTSDPKGVQQTYGNLRHHLATLQRVYGLTATSRILNNLSLQHVDGFVQGALLALHTGCTYVRPLAQLKLQEYDAFLSSPYRYQVSHVFVAPALLNIIVHLEGAKDAMDYDEAQMIISSGAILQESLWELCEQVFDCPVVNVYGLTETVAGSLFAGPEGETRIGGTAGIPVDCEARIVDDQGEDATGSGELWLRGPHITPGYIGRPDLTSAVLNADGWFSTGDLAVMKDDCFVIQGRKSHAVNVSGFLVRTEEVVEVLEGLEGVREAACLGVLDTRGEERVGAAVVLEPKHDWEKLTPERLRVVLSERLRSELEEYKIPIEIQVWPRLPRTHSGKIQSSELKEDWKRLTVTSGETDGQGKEALLDAARRVFRTDDVNFESQAMKTPGWDSMAHMDFITTLEKLFDVRFTPAEMMRATSIRATWEILEKLSQR